MPSTNNPDFEKRPTMRMIALQVGVTHTTVSLALRNHPTISPKMRKKVQCIAKKLGYRPDPEVGKLMSHLRLKHKPRFSSTIAALTSIPEKFEQPYAAALRKGAQRAADALGHGFSLFQIEGVDKRNTSLQRILVSRGIEGVLLLPMREKVMLTNLLDWGCFSVVAATYGVLAPHFHRVVPDQFDNTRLICDQLVGQGHRRIGLIAAACTDASVGQRFSAAVVWQNILGGTEFVAPFIYGDGFRHGLRAWFEREQPDAIILDGTEKEAREIAEEMGLSIPGRVEFALTERPGPIFLGGIDQRAAAIGAAAVAQLHAKLQNGEKGVPEVPSVMMIKGHWVPPT